MKFYINIVLLILLASLNSCSAEDPVPTNGENSFVAKLNGSRLVAENTTLFPSGTKYGLSVYKNDSVWLLTVNNSSDLTLYYYLFKITGSGDYLVGEADKNLSFFDNKDTQTSVFIGNRSLDVLYLTTNQNEYIKINKVQGDSIIIGEFKKITLTDPKNPDNKTILTDGKFNINTNTLNQIEP